MLRMVQLHSIAKRMPIVSFETRGVVHHESVPQGQTVSRHYYADILWYCRNMFSKPSLNSGPQQICVLTKGNAPAHTALTMLEFVARNKIAVVPRCRYSPDLMLYELFLFPKLNMSLKGRTLKPYGTGIIILILAHSVYKM